MARNLERVPIIQYDSLVAYYTNAIVQAHKYSKSRKAFATGFPNNSVSHTTDTSPPKNTVISYAYDQYQLKKSTCIGLVNSQFILIQH